MIVLPSHRIENCELSCPSKYARDWLCRRFIDLWCSAKDNGCATRAIMLYKTFILGARRDTPGLGLFRDEMISSLFEHPLIESWTGMQALCMEVFGVCPELTDFFPEQ